MHIYTRTNEGTKNARKNT